MNIYIVSRKVEPKIIDGEVCDTVIMLGENDTPLLFGSKQAAMIRIKSRCKRCNEQIKDYFVEHVAVVKKLNKQVDVVFLTEAGYEYEYSGIEYIPAQI